MTKATRQIRTPPQVTPVAKMAKQARCTPVERARTRRLKGLGGRGYVAREAIRNRYSFLPVRVGLREPHLRGARILSFRSAVYNTQALESQELGWGESHAHDSFVRGGTRKYQWPGAYRFKGER